MAGIFLIKCDDNAVREFLTLCVKAAGSKAEYDIKTSERPCAALLSAEYAQLSEDIKAEYKDCRVIFLGGNFTEGESLQLPLLPEQLAHILDECGKTAPEDSILDENTCVLNVKGKDIALTLNEQVLLKYFARNPNRAFSNEELALEVFGADVADVHTLTGETAASLSKKLEGASDIWALKHLWGVGYKFEIMI